ncbi:MAG TPA: sigma-70 family RNA polymerase sigma factor [Actinomycetota bacterium]|nr:sigma-70 family RNA polymerase sigma factor [Actinomycetota bacterium]
MAERPARIERLYAEHAPGAMRLALLLTGSREQAEDLVQEAFVRIFGSFAHLRIRTSFRAYLNRTIVNLSRDRGRRRRLERREIEREGRSARAGAYALPDVGAQQEVLDALRALPQRQRTAVVLRYYEDLPEQQVADALGCSLSAAKSLISRGMETLRATMRGEDR